MQKLDSMIATYPRSQAGHRGGNDGARPAAARTLRVLLVVECAGGGTGRHVLDLARGLAARGCDVHLLYSPLRMDALFAERLTKLIRSGGMTCATIPVRSSIHPSDLSVALKVRRYLNEHGPFDLVHGHSSKGGALARLAAFGTGCPALYTPHGLIVTDPSVALPKRALYLLIEWALSRVTKRIIAVSPEECRASARSGLGRRRLTVVPNGVEPAITSRRDEMRRRLGFSKNELVVGFVGRLVDGKAPHLLLEAFARVSADSPQARLVVIGDGPLMSRLRELAAELDISDRVILLGQRDARSEYAGFDLFAICSRKEGLPYVVLEAMAAGLPVVATESSGVEMLVEPGVNGEVVPRDDMPAFAEALGRLISDGSLRERYAMAARERAMRFTIEGMVDATLDVYHDAIGVGHSLSAPAAEPRDEHMNLDAETALEVIA